MTTRLLTRIASWFEASPMPAAASSAGGAWEQGNAAIADVTRWGWLPALSGVSIAADHAATAHRETAAAASKG
ncbi:hypothetical protein JOE40_003919 [Arthrobacter sp. PvP102]|jgi:hypothetical protein|uniref:hypothetical protein n=1 Tax=unclassified Arthrobacter TaxID=235627 RepID=UPI0005BA4151|nr:MULTISPECIES: hypothetical protein [unclassified Arthrobacter]MBP1234276.1 hypothetical protein [Arthrobacter sp. PvP103]MBP1239410.1 hypothetical protein [Arthrobacter sp. PvP102]